MLSNLSVGMDKGLDGANGIPTRQIFPDSVLMNGRIEELDNASVSEAINCTISAIVVNLLPCTERTANSRRRILSNYCAKSKDKAEPCVIINKNAYPCKHVIIITGHGLFLKVESFIYG